MSRGGRAFPVTVARVEPSPSIAEENFEILFLENKAEENVHVPVALPNSQSGFGRQLNRVLRVLKWCFSENSVGSPHGILLHGPSGSGKTHLVRVASEQCGCKIVSCSGGSGERGYIGAAAEIIRETVQKGLSEGPCLIVFDEVDGLLSSENGVVEGGAVVLMGFLDSLHSQSSPVVVIVISSKPHRLPASLRRAGRLEVEVEVGQLERGERVALLESLVGKSGVPSNLTLSGMLAGDIAATAREASLLASIAGRDKVSQQDVLDAVRRIQTGARRGWDVDIPNVNLDEVGGMEDVKQRLIECIEWPIKHSEAFVRLGIKPSTGILLYGPPGNGKTLIARAVASRFSCSFIVVKGPELFSKYVGESERALAKVFSQARQQHPCVVFLDEIDALAPRRTGGGGQVTDRMLSTLLSQLDGVSPLRGVTVIAATNRPDHLDHALLRPGRLSHHLYVPLPSAKARESIFLSLLAKVPISMSNEDISHFATEDCDGYSGAECASIVREAKLISLCRNEDSPSVKLDDLREALSQNPKRTSKEMLEFYENWKP